MRQVIAMHGWSGDSVAWAPWERHFSRQGWLWQSGERGYGHRSAYEPSWAETNMAQPKRARRVVIGHSLGPHLLSTAVLNQATDVVLLASFGRFVPTGPEGLSLIHI